MKVINHDEVFDRILNAPIPAATDTYSPIAHSEFIVTLKNLLRSNNYSIRNKRGYSNKLGTQMIGFYDIEINSISNQFGMDMSIGFKNSYDKTMSAALAVGAVVTVCGNGVISGDLLTFKRRHRGLASEELRVKINEAINLMNNNYLRLLTDAEIMKDYELTLKQKAEILGVMYFEEDMLTPTQVSIIKKELTQSENFTDNTLWDLYNNVTESLKLSHPMHYIENHIRLHSFMTELAGISNTPILEDVVQETI